MIIHADCVEAMQAMEPDSVDAIVCDPPYSLGFMSKPWDMQVDHQAWATEALCVLKPGGHLLAFGGTRTYHRLACAVEDAGFEIRDSLIWIYGSGFPKSLDVSKAIDKAAGAERRVVGRYQLPSGQKWNLANDEARPGGDGATLEGGRPALRSESMDVTAPATPEAQHWQGWGTALKPSHEPIVVARKPLVGTVAANVLEHGTGALNIDGCRVGADPGYSYERRGGSPIHNGGQDVDAGAESNPAGRWPPNLTLSHLPECNSTCAEGCPVAELDRQSGERRSSGEYERHHVGAMNGAASIPISGGETQYGDTGGASRFFYVAKASRAERNAGASQNVHPTVKPIALMRWLVRLVTPKGGTVLDPFTGSGSTGVAAVLEGFDFVGIEREAEYVALAEARVAFWAQFPGADVDKVLLSDARAREIEASGQMGLL